RRHRTQLAYELADREAELHRTSALIAMPERRLARFTRRRGNQHAIVRDLLDAPGRCAERERLTDLGLEDHFLVQFTSPSRAIRAGEEHAVESAIGNGSRVRDCHTLGAGAA